MKLTIPIPEKISLNKIYSGIHFRTRMAHKQQYQYAVTSALPEKYTGHFPASTHYHFKIKGRGLDISNYAYMQKLLEDSLVAHGVLPDDTPKYVGELRITAEKAPKGAQDEVVVTIVPVGRKTA